MNLHDKKKRETFSLDYLSVRVASSQCPDIVCAFGVMRVRVAGCGSRPECAAIGEDAVDHEECSGCRNTCVEADDG